MPEQPVVIDHNDILVCQVIDELSTYYLIMHKISTWQKNGKIYYEVNIGLERWHAGIFHQIVFDKIKLLTIFI